MANGLNPGDKVIELAALAQTPALVFDKETRGQVPTLVFDKETQGQAGMSIDY